MHETQQVGIKEKMEKEELAEVQISAIWKKMEKMEKEKIINGD